ncbi:MAG: pentapeptide repeat-containing protein [Cyanobacteria bacterium P01_D01_bin.50]
MSRSTVTKFFQLQPVQFDSFKRICDGLKLNWREIAGLPAEESLQLSSKKDCNELAGNEEGRMVGTIRRQVTVINGENNTVKAVITLEGNINSVSNLKIIELILREHSGDTIKINDIKEGSIKLNIEGSPEDIQKLVEHIQSGELKEVNGFPVENIQVNDSKWQLVQEIVSQGAIDRDLNGVDLSDTDLSGTNLIGANLNGADLSGTDLSGAYLIGADLRNTIIDSSTNLEDKWHLVWKIVNQPTQKRNLIGANLIGANLIGANLIGANLIGAYLIGANLSNANLNYANVQNTQFSYATGISEQLKRNLIKRGAIFEDSPGENSPIYSPTPSRR